jgi:acetamidase/formamidase
MGVMGMAPDEPGILSTRPPRVCGGNIDCKELVEGSTVFLPIAVKGGLFSTGDGHAAQGDGEASGTAIECPMERVELEFHIHPTLRLSMPRAHTPIGWVVMGLHEDLEEASLAALEEIVVLMEELHGVDRYEALILAGVAVDLRITQIVNGVCGVHAVLPHGAIQKTD